jgi:hypothetical protein
MIVNIAIRGFLGRRKLFESQVPIESSALDQLLPDLAETHSTAMAAGELDMIEIEFLDEPNVNERFFRIGTNSRGMVKPMAIDL